MHFLNSHLSILNLHRQVCPSNSMDDISALNKSHPGFIGFMHVKNTLKY